MIRETTRWPRSDEEAYDVGFQVSIWIGFPQAFAFGWRSEFHPAEWSFELMLGPLSIHLWRPR